jgi:toxin ParE1/3/4
MSSNREYTLFFSEDAENDLDNINFYTLTTWGEQQLYRYAATLEQAFADIAKNPAIGRSREGLPQRFKGYSVGKHVIFYTVAEEAIFVVRILHSSMDFGQHLE